MYSMGQFDDGYDGKGAFRFSLRSLDAFENVPNTVASALTGDEQAGIQD